MNILLIEDDTGIAEVLRRGLEAFGHPVDWVSHGWEALERIEIYHYDLVILDLMLPDRDGIDLCRQFRQNEVQSSILILSARDRTDQRIAGLDAGADDYMVKPFSFEELIARIRALGRRVAKAGEFVKFEIGDLILDVQARSVTVAGAPVNLTLKEFQLLQFLIKNKDRAVSRESIVSSVWGADADVTMNAVDVYVGYIRKKCGLHERLLTLRGHGFQLNSRLPPTAGGQR
jgi:DNA-binding response OmpR family regulator